MMREWCGGVAKTRNRPIDEKTWRSVRDWRVSRTASSSQRTWECVRDNFEGARPPLPSLSEQDKAAMAPIPTTSPPTTLTW
jgi:hypothetical protein